MDFQEINRRFANLGEPYAVKLDRAAGRYYVVAKNKRPAAGRYEKVDGFLYDPDGDMVLCNQMCAQWALDWAALRFRDLYRRYFDGRLWAAGLVAN